MTQNKFKLEEGKETFTREEVEGLVNQFVGTIEELNNKVEASSKVAEKLQELEKSNISLAIKNKLVKNGLNEEEYFDLVFDSDVSKAETKINKLVAIKKKQDADESYKPTNHKKTNEYENAEKQNDVNGMITSKISKLFK